MEESSNETTTASGMLSLKEEQNSYIASAKERMSDVITNFLTTVDTSVTLSDFSQIFKTTNVWVRLRPRKLSQYAEIIQERSGDGRLSVRYSDEEFLPNIKETLKENRLKVISIEHNIIDCKTPKPSDQDIDIAVQKIKVLGSTARNSLAQVKADSIQRLQAALKNEYVEARDVKQAADAIENIEQKFAMFLLYVRLEAEKKLAGKFFKHESDEIKNIHLSMIRRVKKDGCVEI
jgi:ribosome recycling factor